MRALELPVVLLALLAVVAPLLVRAAAAAEDKQQQQEFNSTSKRAGERNGRFFNVLQVVRFPNDACNTGSSRNGTCYTEAECAARSGTNDGSCADGFGVCCVFSIGCGQTSNENCTYFEVSGATAGGCQATICPCGDHICQLRLDFNTFAIAGPETASDSAFKQSAGLVDPVSTKLASLRTNCLTDTFAVTNPGGSAPPTICGTNAGEHMYVDSSEACNDLTFQIGLAATSAARTWSIKVTQLSCKFNNLAPEGCTQYFFGANSGMIRTFNYQSGNGVHLANQNQAFCFRRERGFCAVCVFAAIDAMDFMISGTIAAGQVRGTGGDFKCCAYTDGAAIDQSFGYDCLQVPGATNGVGLVKGSKACGRAFINTRCTTQQPFLVRFLSDGFEHATAAISESTQQDQGFELGFYQDSANC